MRARIWFQEYVDCGYGEAECEGEREAERDF
jgi:hypothetical protein